MSLVLDTNINSLNAQNNLSGSQALAVASPWSVCLRVCASTAPPTMPPAWPSASNSRRRSTARIRLSATPNDAVSEAQTTAGALNTIVNNLQSIRTLAVESANGSNSSSDRTALNNQVQQQIAEITPDRAADHLQWFERAQRHQRHHDLPGRRERRRHHRHRPRRRAWVRTRSVRRRRRQAPRLGRRWPERSRPLAPPVH